MIEVKVTLEGFKELEQKLGEKPQQYSLRVIREKLRKAVQPWIDEIRLGAARGDYATGFMASQVDSVVSEHQDRGAAMVGLTKQLNPRGDATAAQEAFWKELGTAKEPARPFIRPAFEAKKDTVLSNFTSELAELLEEFFT
jgi:HK97 gp10 family phage protein